MRSKVLLISKPVSTVLSKRWFLALFIGVCTSAHPGFCKTPDASSTLLKMHRLYAHQPPHETSLYDVLGVKPNATLAQIQKSYRKLTRDLHPDKANDATILDKANDDLQKVREAYEVLKDDSTRLPYHRYGLMDANHAAFILTGAAGAMTNDQRELLKLMGYDTSVRLSHSQRVVHVAAHLLERMRPLVEGAVSKSVLADSIAQECDRLKRLPFGAQILRCVGRAYRHSGQRVLRKHQQRHSGVTDSIRDTLRGAKQILTAAAAGGRVVLTEHFTNSRFQPKSQLPQIDSLELGELIVDANDLASHLHSDCELKEKQHVKAQKALLESLQIEALWKITKIDLDRTIQEACSLILDGKYFFFPSNQAEQQAEWDMGGDGWVGSTGKTIDANIGRLMAASVLVLMGDVMVKCSKEGTSWIE